MSPTSPPLDQDASISSPPPPPGTSATSNAPQEPLEPKYGGFTRFEIELEFVQTLANPFYLLHLATSASPDTSPPVPFLQHPPFIAYLQYLSYFTTPPYRKYLTYPGPTLKNLELLLNERFRREVLSPEVVGRLGEEGVRAAVEFHSGKM